MKKPYTFRRTLSAMVLLLLVGTAVTSCGDDDGYTSNGNQIENNDGNGQDSSNSTGNTEGGGSSEEREEKPIPEGAHIWEYYAINSDGVTARTTSELSSYPYNDNSYDIIYVPSIVEIDGKKYQVTGIGSETFRTCRSLTEVIIPNDITSIGYEAFKGCTSLIEFTIPNGVTSIGSETFSGCGSLTEFTIPSSITSIGSDAFSGCANITDFICHATTPPTCRSYPFNGVKKQTCTLHVPQGCAEAYSEADEWKEFINIVEDAE